MDVVGFVKKRVKWAMDPPAVVPVIRLDGVIGATGGFRPGMSLSTLAEPIYDAFSFRKSDAVAVIINSPGGAPVQSALIHDRIRKLAEENEKKVYCFVEDVAASGGYWLATSGDEIYAHQTSIVGSIGVIAATFGFDKFIAKHGVERRVYTQGTQKSMLDPFMPEDEADIKRLKAMQKEIHQAFIDHVKTRRGEKLTSRVKLFEGDVWTGEKAKELGLIDGLGDVRSVMQDKYGEEVILPVVNAPPRRWMRFLGLDSRGPDMIGDIKDPKAWVHAAVDTIEERTMWTRYGL